jgi:hypothetical protein
MENNQSETMLLLSLIIEISSSRVFRGSRYGASDGKESERRLFLSVSYRHIETSPYSSVRTNGDIGMPLLYSTQYTFFPSPKNDDITHHGQPLG